MYFSIVDEYITNADDTIYRITNMFYMNWNLWRIIYDYNRNMLGDDPYLIPAGRKVKIIGLNTEQIVHTIKCGDTWHTLSRAYWGTEQHWQNIASANEYKHLIDGETLIIPALVSVKDIKKAKELRDVCS